MPGARRACHDDSQEAPGGLRELDLTRMYESRVAEEVVNSQDMQDVHLKSFILGVQSRSPFVTRKVGHIWCISECGFLKRPKISFQNQPSKFSNSFNYQAAIPPKFTKFRQLPPNLAKICQFPRPSKTLHTWKSLGEFISVDFIILMQSIACQEITLGEPVFGV